MQPCYKGDDKAKPVYALVRWFLLLKYSESDTIPDVSVFYILKLEGNFMNKSELIDSIAEKSGLNKTQAGDALNAVMESVGEALEAGDSISLVGFGTFSVKDRKARTGRNPKTGEELSIPASKVPSFKAGKNLKERLN